jgi:two-component system, cell cycle response regulator DivK
MPLVLYIEDNEANRMLVRRVLMASDYDIELMEASNAVSGIEMAREKAPDLILMDLSMPEMDGLTATQKIRELPMLDEVPVIALTANVMTGDRERTLAAGCDGYIGKPIDIEKFPDEIMAFMQKRRIQHD